MIVHLWTDALDILKDLPGEGWLIPHLSSVRAGDRATEFRSRWNLRRRLIQIRTDDLNTQGCRCREMKIQRLNYFRSGCCFLQVQIPRISSPPPNSGSNFGSGTPIRLTASSMGQPALTSV